jgi:hypothetical protein
VNGWCAAVWKRAKFDDHENRGNEGGNGVIRGAYDAQLRGRWQELVEAFLDAGMKEAGASRG